MEPAEKLCGCHVMLWTTHNAPPQTAD